MTDPIHAPVRYQASYEHPEKDEAATEQGLNDALHEIMETTSKDYGHAVRSVHAKPHGVLTGRLEVFADLPAELAQGLFAQAGSYDVVMRISTNPGDILDDDITVPRGLALKVLGVPGARLPGSEGDATQDFVLVNGPAFATPTGSQFLANLKLLAKSTDKAEWAKKGLSAILRGTEALIEAVGGESAKLKTMGGAANVHPLGETYYSQTPFLYGDHIAKFAVFPVSANLTDRTGDIVNAAGRPDAIREAVSEVMIEGDATWELRVQLCRDIDKMPIEDASALWDEAASPFVTVARLTAPAQGSGRPDRVTVVDDQLRYSVWTGLAAHRPLGSINRLRNSTYVRSSDFRGRFNGCPIHEPAALPEALATH